MPVAELSYRNSMAGGRTSDDGRRRRDRPWGRGLGVALGWPTFSKLPPSQPNLPPLGTGIRFGVFG
eukprot:7819260-Pyramimonas_sp.AAC.1